MSEEWRTVSVRPDRYEVSNLGRVRSVIDGKVHVLKPSLIKHGYHRYGFNINGKNHYYKAHRLVAVAFMGEPTGPVVRHLDGDPGNNALSNLAYGTHSDNMLDAVRHGTQNHTRKTHCIHGHPFDEWNTCLSGGKRHCLTCSRARTARSAVKRRERERAEASVGSRI